MKSCTANRRKVYTYFQKGVHQMENTPTHFYIYVYKKRNQHVHLFILSSAG